MDQGGIFLIILAIIFIFYFINRVAQHIADNAEKYKQRLDRQYWDKERELNFKIYKEKEILKRREEKINSLLQSKEILHFVSDMYADVKTWIYDDAERYLREKSHPAKTAADTVKELKAETKKYLCDYRKNHYKISRLLDVFPELTKYMEEDSEDAITALRGDSIDDYKEKYDRRRDYLSTEEWSRLSESQKSQLSLDRYNKRDKSNWVIGVEYEMYVEYLLRLEGYNTIPHGSLKRLSDLGRDVIASKVIDGKLQIYIIQCKRYGLGKEIHENTICQLYGTTMEYELSNHSFLDEIIPCLYTTVPLSDMAQKFAERLGVKVVSCIMGEYPQIKCNISSTGEKIYHLPFDQQYYNTIIDKEGEFYAWNVGEAERAGFRRARKYIQ